MIVTMLYKQEYSDVEGYSGYRNTVSSLIFLSVHCVQTWRAFLLNHQPRCLLFNFYFLCFPSKR